MNDPDDLPLDAATRAAAIAGVLDAVAAHYVFPDAAERMAEAVRARLAAGEYDGLTSTRAFCEALTAHLQAVCGDRHLRVVFDAEPRPPRGGEPAPEEREEARRLGALRNYGFARVERLPGNVGYLDLRAFASPEDAGETAVAAMALLAHTAALVVDLRQNGGGHPGTIALLTTYLVGPEPVHLNDIHWRGGDRLQQWWTLPYVPGRRYGDKPVYVLTSGFTFSAAEEFAYNLKQLGRATLVGEVTRGGAHPGNRRFQITEHVVVGIPTARSVNPLSGTNWEGVGVEPDIAVPRGDALRVAHAAALRAVLARLGPDQSRPARELAREARAALAELEPGAPG